MGFQCLVKCRSFSPILREMRPRDYLRGNTLVHIPASFDDVVDINMELQANAPGVDKPLPTFLTKYFDEDPEGVLDFSHVSATAVARSPREQCVSATAKLLRGGGISAIAIALRQNVCATAKLMGFCNCKTAHHAHAPATANELH